MDEAKAQAHKKSADYYLFIASDEKVIFETQAILNDITKGWLILTDKKLFFYFVSNISRDKVFIATHPYIISAELKEGLSSSTLVINNKKESFKISRIDKKEARQLKNILQEIIAGNKNQ